jgi:hypothetical protein
MVIHQFDGEEIMSKTNDTSRPATLDDHRALADSELDAVTGGWLPTGIPGAAAAAAAAEKSQWNWMAFNPVTLKGAE